MELGRAQLSRVLKLARTVKSNEAVIKDGKIYAQSDTGAVKFRGEAPKIEIPMGLIDVNLFANMLGKCKAEKVQATVGQRQLRIVDGDLALGYKLADLDVLEVPDDKFFDKVRGLVTFTLQVKIEQLMRISDIVKTILASEITFKEKDGELNVVVGKEEVFYGKVVWKDSKPEMAGLDMKFLQSELVPIIDTLDHEEVTIGFACNANENRCIMIKQPDSEWFVGAIAKEEK